MLITPKYQYAYLLSNDNVIIKFHFVKFDYFRPIRAIINVKRMKPRNNREAVVVWLCSAATRPNKRSKLVCIYMYTGAPNLGGQVAPWPPATEIQGGQMGPKVPSPSLFS